MEPTERESGQQPAEGKDPREVAAQVRFVRRAESLRANLRRRKAQTRGRADLQRETSPSGD